LYPGYSVLTILSMFISYAQMAIFEGTIEGECHLVHSVTVIVRNFFSFGEKMFHGFRVLGKCAIYHTFPVRLELGKTEFYLNLTHLNYLKDRACRRLLNDLGVLSQSSKCSKFRTKNQTVLIPNSK
jgi:hypothetical protein